MTYQEMINQKTQSYRENTSDGHEENAAESSGSSQEVNDVESDNIR